MSAGTGRFSDDVEMTLE